MVDDDDGEHRWFRDTGAGELVDSSAIKLENQPLFGLDEGRAEATHGGWKVIVEGFATNQEAEAFATYLVTRFAELGGGKVVTILKDSEGSRKTK